MDSGFIKVVVGKRAAPASLSGIVLDEVSSMPLSYMVTQFFVTMLVLFDFFLLV